jgi:hypothetical protein
MSIGTATFHPALKPQPLVVKFLHQFPPGRGFFFADLLHGLLLRNLLLIDLTILNSHPSRSPLLYVTMLSSSLLCLAAAAAAIEVVVAAEVAAMMAAMAPPDI